MQRRKFIKLTSTVSALTLLPTEVFAMLKSSGISSCMDNSNKKIVLIQLAGGNDGINTLVPLNQYDLYRSLRPTVGLKNSGANKLINLDSTLPLENQIGLHPVLKGFKNLYDNGLMHIVQGVGYPNVNKSHFKSSDLWLTGGDGSTSNFSFESGWLGRFIENYYTKYLKANFPLGIQLGSGDNSLGFHGEKEHDLSININNQDSLGFYSVLNGLGGSPPKNIPNSEYGDRIRLLLDIDASTNYYGNTISTAFNKGVNSVTYPETDLSNQLRTVARFISGGLQTKVYLVRLAGFDTHENQVLSNSESHLGQHANLLKELSDAVNSFVIDLKNQNKSNDVLTMTFSEFGRKVSENANLGTDHGEVAPMFLFGNVIEPGISGVNVNLNEAIIDNNYQVNSIQFDYRSVFGTVLQDWFGTSNDVLDSTLFDYNLNKGYSETKINNLITPQSKVPYTCYSSEAGPFDTEQKMDIILYPNPCSDYITISSTISIQIKKIIIFSIDGKLILSIENESTEQTYSLDVKNLSAGLYNSVIETNAGIFNKKIIVRR